VSLNRLGCRRAYVEAMGLPMRVLIFVVLVLGSGLILILGLLSVMQALLDRTTCQPPLISDGNPNSEQLHQSRTVSHSSKH
jgi:hypothetical protein